MPDPMCVAIQRSLNCDYFTALGLLLLIRLLAILGYAYVVWAVVFIVYFAYLVVTA